jgi:hypothetical protein
MDYTQVMHDIQKLTKELNVWTLKLHIPIYGSTDKRLDISSATMGDNSFAPIGAKNQPLTYPPGLDKIDLVYIFYPMFSGRES